MVILHEPVCVTWYIVPHTSMWEVWINEWIIESIFSSQFHSFITHGQFIEHARKTAPQTHNALMGKWAQISTASIHSLVKNSFTEVWKLHTIKWGLRRVWSIRLGRMLLRPVSAQRRVIYYFLKIQQVIQHY